MCVMQTVLRRSFALIDENGDIVRMKRVPKLATVAASVDPAAGVMFLSCPSCVPSVIAVPLRESIDAKCIEKAAACLVSSVHEEICFGQICRKVITDPQLRLFFWQATGRTLYVTRQFNADTTFSNDGHMLLCATASLHLVRVFLSSSDLILAQTHTNMLQLHSWSNHRQTFAQMQQFRPNFVVVRNQIDSQRLLLIHCFGRRQSLPFKKNNGSSFPSSANKTETCLPTYCRPESALVVK